MNLSREDRFASFNSAVSEGRVIRHKWRDGKGRACLLASFGADINGSRDCPSEVMPAWLAELTPSIDDKGSDAAWPAMVRRYAAVANRWHVLDDKAWRRVLLRFLDSALATCETFDTNNVVAPVRALIAKELSGLAVADAEWRAAWAAEAAAWAAWAAAWAARAAWDRMTADLLLALEEECAKAESAK